MSTSPVPLCDVTLNIFKLPCIHDQSVAVLKEVFGNAVSDFAGGTQVANGFLIPTILGHLNAVIVSGVLAVYAIILVIGTLNTAKEGIFLGKQWSSTWTPLRMILGPILIIPAKTGLCAIQTILLALILYGVHMATAVWYASVNDIKLGVSPTVPTSMYGQMQRSAGDQFLARAVMNALNITGEHKEDGMAHFFVPFIARSVPYSAAIGTQQVYDIQQTFLNLCEASFGVAPQGSVGALSYDNQQYLKGCFRNTYAMAGSPAAVGADPSLSFYNRTADQNIVWDAWIDDGTNVAFWAMAAYNSGDTRWWQSNLVDGRPIPSPGTPDTYSPTDSIIMNAYPQNEKNLWNKGNGLLTYGDMLPNSGLANATPPAEQKAGAFVSIPDPGMATGTVPGELQNFIVGNVVGDGCYLSTPAPGGGVTPASCDFSVIAQAVSDRFEQNTTPPQIEISQNTNVYAGSCGGKIDSPECQKAIATHNFSGNGGNSAPDAVNTDLASSWWYAGEVYLQLDQMLANNLGDLYKKLSALNASPGDASFTVGMNLSTFLLVRGTSNLIPPVVTAGIRFSNWYQYATALPGWAEDIDVFNPKYYIQGADGRASPNADFASGGLTYAQVNEMFTLLQSTPLSMQLPLQTFLRSTTFGGATTPMARAPYALKLYRILKILNLNGYLLTSTQAAQNLPSKMLIDSLFKSLFGGRGNGQQVGDNVNNVMDEIYSIGMTDSTQNSVGKNLSVIANTQRVGVDVILTVVSSIQSVYQSFLAQTTDMINEINNYQFVAIIGGTILQAASFGAAAADAAGGPAFHAEGASAALSTAAGTLIEILHFKVEKDLLIKNNQLSQQMMYLPLVSVIMMLMFTIGISFALIIPLTPFVLFWGGQMAWILGSIEAVVAAPLLMLAFSHPGGHDVMGHSHQGLKMLMGIIFRPVLMVMGLLIGLVLTYILVALSAQGFHLVGSAIIGGTGLDGGQIPGMISDGIDPTGMARGILGLFLLFIYAQFLMKVFNKCFSLIYLLPDKALEWIGGHRERNTGGEDMQEMTSATTRMSDQGAQAATQGQESGIKANQSMMSESSGLAFSQAKDIKDTLGTLSPTIHGSVAAIKHKREEEKRKLESADKATEKLGVDEQTGGPAPTPEPPPGPEPGEE